MAKVFQRVWRAGTRKVKRAAWGYTVQIDGKQERRFREEWTKEDAAKALAARQLGLAPAPAALPAMTLGAAVEKYLLEKTAGRKRSIRNDRMCFARLKALFGADRPLAEITVQQIGEYRVKRLTETSARIKRPVTPASVNRDLSILRGLLRLAVHEWGALEKMPRIRFEKEPEGRLRFLSEDEAVRLLAACRRKYAVGGHSPHLAAVVTVALHTGMRKSEILGLAWERVDVSRGVILLERTKTGKRREVPMNRPVYDALSSLPRSEDGAGPVFRNASGSAWGSIRTAFERACRDAKIPDFRFHDIRHTFASWLVMRGRPLKEVQELLGHKTITMTMRYAHLSPDRLRDAVAALEDFSTSSAHGPDAGALRLVSTRQN
jgi:integrase